jgi:hypothetical protein
LVYVQVSATKQNVCIDISLKMWRERAHCFTFTKHWLHAFYVLTHFLYHEKGTRRSPFEDRESWSIISLIFNFPKVIPIVRKIL